MSVSVHVEAHSGFRANERPVRFVFDERSHDIAAIEDRWYEPDGEYFKVRTALGKRFILRYAQSADSWTLHSGFDGEELLSRPDLDVVVVGPELVREAERQIEACEQCHPDEAEIPFDWVLQDIVAKSGMVDFVMAEPARCPVCRQPVTEKTLIDRSERESCSF